MLDVAEPPKRWGSPAAGLKELSGRTRAIQVAQCSWKAAWSPEQLGVPLGSWNPPGGAPAIIGPVVNLCYARGQSGHHPTPGSRERKGGLELH